MKPEVSRRQEIIKINMNINEIENKNREKSINKI